MKQIMIPIERITSDSKFIRTEDRRLLKPLIKSIETVGLINPLIVNSNFKLLAGGRRLQALKELHWKEVPCVVYEKEKILGDILTLDENIVRKDLDNILLEEALLERKRLYHEVHPATKRGGDRWLTREERDNKQKRFSADISAKTGISISSVDSMVRRAELSSKKVKQARIDGKLSTAHTQHIVKLREEDQDKLLEVIDGIPLSSMGSIVSEIKKKGFKKTDIEPHYDPLRRLLSRIDRASRTLDLCLRKIIREEIVFVGDAWPDVSLKLHRARQQIISVLERQKQVRK
jgi:hypothetical protein